MQIRPATDTDIPQLVEVWERGSLIAHDFIPATYWRGQREAMAEQYLPAAETYVIVASDGERPAGFLSLMDSRVAALFIEPEAQGRGLGRELLRHAMSLRDSLDLQVYQKNESAIKFYKRQGFVVTDSCTDPNTGEAEYVMAWSQHAAR